MVNEDILISVHPRHVDSMLSGRKTVELRRRPLNLSRGCRVWIYCTLPRGSVEAFGTVRTVATGAPADIWRDYGSQAGITMAEFDAYYQDTDVAYAIVFSAVKKLPFAIKLDEIRKHRSSFQPPQFFKRLSINTPELKLFTSVSKIPLAA